MKRLVFMLLVFVGLSVGAQDTTSTWGKELIPDFATAQFAGSMGTFSAGFGYEIIGGKALLSFHYGNVPESVGGPLNIGTARFQWRPWEVELSDEFLYRPLVPVFFTTYHFDDEFYLSWPNDRYPAGYYWWTSALRFHIGVRSEMEFDIFGPKNSTLVENFSAFVEANTNDLYIYSYFPNNQSIGFFEIWKLGAGIRVNL